MQLYWSCRKNNIYVQLFSIATSGTFGIIYFKSKKHLSLLKKHCLIQSWVLCWAFAVFLSMWTVWNAWVKRSLRCCLHALHTLAFSKHMISQCRGWMTYKKISVGPGQQGMPLLPGNWWSGMHQQQKGEYSLMSLYIKNPTDCHWNLHRNKCIFPVYMHPFKIMYQVG